MLRRMQVLAVVGAHLGIVDLACRFPGRVCIYRLNHLLLRPHTRAGQSGTSCPHPRSRPGSSSRPRRHHSVCRCHQNSAPVPARGGHLPPYRKVWLAPPQLHRIFHLFNCTWTQSPYVVATILCQLLWHVESDISLTLSVN